MSRNEESNKIMQEAIPLGTMGDVHQYGRTLLTSKQPLEAFKVFKMNYDKNPNVFTTNVGMGRGYSATGDHTKALDFMKAALLQAPTPIAKSSVEKMIKKLQEGKYVN